MPHESRQSVGPSGIASRMPFPVSRHAAARPFNHSFKRAIGGHHRYVLVSPPGATPVEGEALVTGPGQELPPDHA